MLLINRYIICGLGSIAVLAMTNCTTMTPHQACYVADVKLQGHYSGTCQKDKAHGRGKAIGKDMYEGEFVNGVVHGSGTYTWADGERFVGQFKQGDPQIPHVGCYVVDPRLRGTYTGGCRNAKAYGQGKAVGIDTYQGEFVDGVVHGRGTYVWSNGDRYIGQFQQGKAHGRGVMKYDDGEEEIGRWKNNQWVE